MTYLHQITLYLVSVRQILALLYTNCLTPLISFAPLFNGGNHAQHTGLSRGLNNTLIK